MNGSQTHGGFPHGFGPGRPGPGRPGAGLFEAFDQLRSMFEQRVSTRMSRGDVRAAVLTLLAERPMHGYQIITEIEQRSGGMWKPSAGSVYPTLQLLADEGLIEATESNGRKTYSLTEQGRAEVAEDPDRAAPWEAFNASGRGALGALPKAGIDLAQAAAQVGRTGTPEQVAAAVAVLDDARRRLYGILAGD
jgi:DNA-binding PadR family transcriptional regulator